MKKLSSSQSSLKKLAYRLYGEKGNKMNKNCFVVRDCTKDANYVVDDFGKACEKARQVACKYFGSKNVIYGAYIFYRENNMPKYVATVKAVTKDEVKIRWYAPNDNLYYAFENNMLNPLD